MSDCGPLISPLTIVRYFYDTRSFASTMAVKLGQRDCAWYAALEAWDVIGGRVMLQVLSEYSVDIELTILC